MKKKLIVILSILTFISCDTASVNLNDVNYVFNGRGGVKCLVNGNLLKPSLVTSPGATSAWFSVVDEEYYDVNALHLSFRNRGQSPYFIDQFLTLKVTDVSTTSSMVGNIFDLGEEPNQGEYSIANAVYKTNNIYSGTLQILYHDIDNNILAGSFEFDAINEDGDVIEIRGGQFDLKY